MCVKYESDVLSFTELRNKGFDEKTIENFKKGGRILVMVRRRVLSLGLYGT